MKRLGDFILKQSRTVLENKQHAVVCAVMLALLPFASWLSVALVSLVTLRKGAKAGFEVMLPALVVHSAPLMLMMPVSSALINTLVAYVPCYCAAYTLRNTQGWHYVAGVFLLQAVIGVALIQMVVPEFIIGQFEQLKSVFNQFAEYKELVAANSAVNTFILAQLFFGIQIVTVLVSATVSLLFARSVQAKLVFPEGFKKEIRAFRSGRVALAILFLTALAAYYEIPIGINLLPLVLCYFIAAGFNLAYVVLAGKKRAIVFALLLLTVVLKPSIVLCAYIIFGSLDSIFNFRLYLPARASKST